MHLDSQLERKSFKAPGFLGLKTNTSLDSDGFHGHFFLIPASAFYHLDTLSPSRSALLAVVTTLSDSCISFLLFPCPLLPMFPPWMLTKCVKIMTNTRKRKIIKFFRAGEISQQLLLYQSYQLSE